MLVKGLRINKICYFISKDFTKMRFDAFSIPHVALAYKRIKTTKKKTGTRGSANIDSVPRAQGKIESNMAYPDMFVQLATTLGTELLLTAG